MNNSLYVTLCVLFVLSLVYFIRKCASLSKKIAFLETLLESERWFHYTYHDLWKIERLKALKELPSAQQWIPCSARLPIPSEYDERDMVLTCEACGYVYFNMLHEGKWVLGNPIAWMCTPKPYKGELT